MAVVDGYTKAATLSDVPPGSLFGVVLNGSRICLANVEGEIYAVRDNCSHKDFPLSAGSIEDDVIVCQWHGARFDPASGRALSLPAIKPVRTFEVKVEGDEIYVKL